MNDPTRDDGVGLLDPQLSLFSENDDVTNAVNDVIGFPFNVDFDFSFDDLSFADDLLLDPNSDPMNLSSDISQVWNNCNSDDPDRNRVSDEGVGRVYETVSSEESNSPEIGSNSDVYSGNCCDPDISSYLLIDDDENDCDNKINCDDLSDLSRKTIKFEVVNGINRISEDISSSGSGSECMSKSKKDRAAETRSGSGSGSECMSKSNKDRAAEIRSGNGSECMSKSKQDRAGEIRSGSGSECVSKSRQDRVGEIRSGSECVSKVKRKIEVEKDDHTSSENSYSRSSSGVSGSACVSKVKRKIEVEQDYGGEIRVSKFRRANMSEIVNVSDENVEGGDDDEKRKARLIRNRESAQLSRQRKKQYVEELEDKVRGMHSTITDLNSKISYFMSENATLRQQLSGGVVPPGVPPPPPGMYPAHPMAPMPYPWMPYPPAYMVKPQGSQVPLVPIPRLKPQNPVSAPKVKKSSEGKKEKGERKTKKVASVSLLGLLFFMLLFGGLMPMVSVRYGRVSNGFDGVQNSAVFTVDKHVDGKFGHRRVLHEMNNSTAGNTSVPLVASLYVPRNDKLVKIDGNLIIHSVLSSEKAMASQTAGGTKTSEETGLAIHGNYPPYPTPGPGSNNWRRPHLDRNQNGRQRALGSGSADFTPIGSDGKIPQWFREGLAEPMLSSGMCTEVFQFDVSPTPGSIVPATSVANITSEDRLNSTRPNIPRNRRILHGHTIPFPDHTLNTTEEHMHPREHNDGLESNKSRSSVVVSVLVDPREVGDGDGEGGLGSKTLPRIFVVVLIDSVKYVTYSCMLPFMGSGSHLITG